MLMAPLRWLAVKLVAGGREGKLTEKLFFAVQAFEYCRGLREAGGIPLPRPLRILTYHAIADTAGAGRFEPYGVRPEDFRQQITELKRAGYRFVSAEEVVHFVRRGGGLPPRPILLTFDDCYASVLEHAIPILAAFEIPAVAFAVTSCLGGTNVWDKPLGALQLPLLDADGLRRVVGAGVEIGAHSRSHRQLTTVSEADLENEVRGSRQELRAADLGPARLFSYPYGECDERVCKAVEVAGCEAAFTVNPGFIHPGDDPFRLARIEILRRDVGFRFRWKVATAGAWRPQERGRWSLADAVWRRLRRVLLAISKKNPLKLLRQPLS